MALHARAGRRGPPPAVAGAHRRARGGGAGGGRRRDDHPGRPSAPSAGRLVGLGARPRPRGLLPAALGASAAAGAHPPHRRARAGLQRPGRGHVGRRGPPRQRRRAPPCARVLAVRHRRGRRLRDPGGPAAHARGEGPGQGAADVSRGRAGGGTGRRPGRAPVPAGGPGGDTARAGPPRRADGARGEIGRGSGAAGAARLWTAVGCRRRDPARGLGGAAPRRRAGADPRRHRGLGRGRGAGRAHAGRRRAGGVAPGRGRPDRAHRRRGGRLGVGVGEDPARRPGRSAGRARAARDPPAHRRRRVGGRRGDR